MIQLAWRSGTCHCMHWACCCFCNHLLILHGHGLILSAFLNYGYNSGREPSTASPSVPRVNINNLEWPFRHSWLPHDDWLTNHLLFPALSMISQLNPNAVAKLCCSVLWIYFLLKPPCLCSCWACMHVPFVTHTHTLSLVASAWVLGTSEMLLLNQCLWFNSSVMLCTPVHSPHAQTYCILCDYSHSNSGSLH